MDRNDRMIPLGDLGAMVLKSIKAILAVTLAFALLAGLFGVYRETRNGERITVTDRDVKKAEQELAATQSILTAEETALEKSVNTEIPNAERKVQRAEQQVERRQQYIDNSLLQAMNPYYHAVSRLAFYVETNAEVKPGAAGQEGEAQESVASAFALAYRGDTELLDHVKDILGIDAELTFIKELISVSAASDRIVEIAVFFDDAGKAEEAVNYIYQELTKRMKESIGPFSPNVISQYTGHEIDWSMNEWQNGSENMLKAAERELEEAKTALQKLRDGIQSKENAVSEAKQALEEQKSELEDLRRAIGSNGISTKKLLRKVGMYIVIGAVLGFAAAAFCAVAGRLLGGKLQNQNDLISRYDFPVLGTLPGHKKRLFEKAICTLEGETGSDLASAAQTAVQSIKTAAGEGSVGLVSTRGQELLKTLHELSDKQFTACGSILDDANAVKAMVACDSVVVVEQKESSHLNLIDAELRRVKALGKPVVGAVVVDADGRQNRKDKAFKQA